jgi:hypothetical protein
VRHWWPLGVGDVSQCQLVCHMGRLSFLGNRHQLGRINATRTVQATRVLLKHIDSPLIHTSYMHQQNQNRCTVEKNVGEAKHSSRTPTLVSSRREAKPEAS